MLVTSEHDWQLVDSQLTHYTETSQPTKTSGSIHITNSSTLFLILVGMATSKNPFLIQDEATAAPIRPRLLSSSSTTPAATLSATSSWALWGVLAAECTASV